MSSLDMIQIGIEICLMAILAFAIGVIWQQSRTIEALRLKCKALAEDHIKTLDGSIRTVKNIRQQLMNITSNNGKTNQYPTWDTTAPFRSQLTVERPEGEQHADRPDRVADTGQQATDGQPDHSV